MLQESDLFLFVNKLLMCFQLELVDDLGLCSKHLVQVLFDSRNVLFAHSGIFLGLQRLRNFQILLE